MTNEPDSASNHEPSRAAQAIGRRIKELRTQQQLSLSELAERAGVSKSYLSTVESGTGRRPGVAVLHKVAVALGVTLADLLERTIKAAPTTDIPDSLRTFAEERDLPEADVQMLAGIKFRGEAPRTKDNWQFIYNAIVMSVVTERTKE
ncbi:helix-turn-helix domain-containing protein [Microbacterium sp.]|uniref:helix-turn-helix domain-containing protein n=1 Tax=Microbacterium sp. TaxID=51671 RepID=UPI002736079A|nr:helix-turn-helix transcriptional regulator [Microbacterium sp.]MDP3951934.1 helix-turn-helix transcriptional regulator [Microbacterium sp.]